MATGAFDLLHPGHGLYLEKAKELGGEDAVLEEKENSCY